MKSEYLIVPDIIPDLDGVACAIAHSEYWSQKGAKAAYGVPIVSRLEPKFVVDELKLSLSKSVKDLLPVYPQVIVVDTSNPQRIDPLIDLSQVVEVIDHRQFNFAEKFTQAKIQIELVGAAATLIAEKFFQEKLPISSSSVTLLYGAIVSNTINFQAHVTTDRDRKMAAWLQDQASLPENFIHRMFAAKSVFEPNKIELEEEMAVFEVNGLKMAMIQLEMLKAEEFILNHRVRLTELMNQLKREQGINYIALSGIDLEKGFNTIMVLEEEYQKIISQALNLQFKNSIAISDRVWMRKEIAPLIKSFIEEEFVS